MASIKDVAQKAGVGRATVSRVINNNGYVAKETREKVVSAMKELNYTPNELARNLFHKRTGIIAVLIPSVSHPFFGSFVECVQSELYKRGFKTMICCADGSDNEKEYLDMLNRHMVDGIISGVHTLDIEEYTKADGPIVALDRFLGERIPIVSVDHDEGGRVAAQELLRCRCKSIVHFRGGENIIAPYRLRHEAFEDEMSKYDVTIHNFDLEWTEFKDPEVREAIESLIAQNITFDGIFGVDLIAVEALNVCRELGLRIPEDVQIVAYDGTYISEMTEPLLTCVVQPMEELAKEIVHHVVRMTDGRIYSNRKRNLRVELRKGGTTR